MSEQRPPNESDEGSRSSLPSLGDIFRRRSGVEVQPTVQRETADEIIFVNRNKARVITPALEVSAPEILGQLGLEEPGAVIIVSGTGDTIDKRMLSRLQQLVSRGIARAAASKEAVIIDRGLHDGVTQLMGLGVADRERQSPLIGVAPRGKVASELFGMAEEKQGKELDPDHSHFVLIEGGNWNDASSLMIELAAAIANNKIIPMRPTPPAANDSEATVEGDAQADSLGDEGDIVENVEGDESENGSEAGDNLDEAPIEPLDEEIENNELGDGENSPDANEEGQADKEPDTKPQITTKKSAVVLLAGGSLDDKDPSKREVLLAVRKGWPVIVLQGSGGLADEIQKLHNERQEAFRRAEIEARQDGSASAKPIRPKPIEDPEIAEIVVDGKLVFFEAEAEAEELRDLIFHELPAPWASEVLQLAWERFALYDKNAGRHQGEFKDLTTRILWLGVLTTFVAILITWLALPGSPTLNDSLLELLRWGIIALPILTSIAIAIFSRRKADTKWLLLRGGAETLKSKIYSYRTLAQIEPRNQLMELQRAVEDMSRQLMQTEVNESALIKYDESIPPKMWGAAAQDDGFSPLEPSQYIDIRIGDQVSFYEGRTKQKEYYLRYYRSLVLVLGGLGTFLAAIGQELWVPLTTAAVTAITTYLLSEQFQETIVVYNQSKTDVLNIKLWWESLSATDKQRPENIQKLVRITENTLSREIRGWVQNMQNALSQLREDISEDQQQPSSG